MANAIPPANPITSDQAKAIRRKLMAWYRREHRKLPWRAEPGGRPDPYHTLISEAMLQQTQVATVVPYFHRFIQAFPTVDLLAAADEQAVLTLWQGLGYYRRARNLHAAAKAIVQNHDSNVPTSVNELLNLPGVGPYTAGAIASIAHGTRAAVVDGNVERVFARLLRIEEPINAPATKKRVWSIAESLVPKAHPGDYNQAMMELGATVCTPKVPRCFVCPVRMNCRAVQETDPQTLPIKLTKKKPKEVQHLVIAAERNGKYLFEQRPADGLWANMWQLPTWEQAPEALQVIKKNGNSRSDTSRQANRDTPKLTRLPRSIAAGISTALIDWFRDRLGLTLGQPEIRADFTHQTTHRAIRFVVLTAAIDSGRLKSQTGVWRRLDQLDDLPMSNPQRQILATLNVPSTAR